MSLRLPSYPDSHYANPLADVYAWVAMISIDFGTGSGRVMVNVHPDAASAAAGKFPLDQVGVTMGRGFPSLAEMMADPQFAAAFGVIRTKLYDHLKALPAFQGAVDVD